MPRPFLVYTSYPGSTHLHRVLVLYHPGLIFQIGVWTLFAEGLMIHPHSKEDVDQTSPVVQSGLNVWFNWSIKIQFLGTLKGNKHWIKETPPDQSIFRGNVYRQNAAIEVKKKKSHKISKILSWECTKQSHNNKKNCFTNSQNEFKQ